LQFDSWDDKETGEKRSKLKVRAERVEFLSGGKDRADTPAPTAPAHAPVTDADGETIPF